MSSICSSTDLSTKYQKLASEYAKLRAQLPVLKRAVLDEQERCSAFQAEVKCRDQTVRKLESEVESLMFRNDQMGKRVEQMQDSYAKLSSPKHTKKNKDLPRSQSAQIVSVAESVLQEELGNKLEENKVLHTKIFELEQSNEAAMHEMEDKFRVLEKSNAQLQKELASHKNRHQAVIESLSAEKIQLEKELENFRQNGFVIASDSFAYPTELNPFLGSNPDLPDQNGLVQSPSRHNNEQLSRDLLKEQRRVCLQLSVTLTNLLTFTQQRSSLYPNDGDLQPISHENVEYCKALGRSVEFLEPFKEAVVYLVDKCLAKTELDTIDCDLKTVIEKLGLLTDFLQSDVAPLFHKSVDEECSISWCGSALEAENQIWKSAFSQFLSQQLPAVKDALESFVKNNSLDQLQSALQSLLQSSNDLLESYHRKLTLEQRLPTATKKFRASNECVLAALTAMSKLMKDLFTACGNEDNLYILTDFWIKAKREASTDSSIGEIDQKKIYLASMKSVDDTQKDELNRLKLELHQIREQLLQKEKEREQLLIDMQLLRCKVEKGETGDGEGEEERGLMHKYYSLRLETIITQLQDTTSHNAYIQQESEQLVSLLATNEFEKEQLNKELDDTKAQITLLQDDLERTRNGYESQLSNLSEHLAEVKHKIAEQTDQINLLRDNPSNKSSRKLRFLRKDNDL